MTMTLGEAIQSVYCPPEEYRSERTGRTLILREPTRREAGRVLRAIILAHGEAAKCVKLMREDAAALRRNPDADTEWSALPIEEQMRMQGDVQELDGELALQRAKLCLRHDPQRKEVSDEELTFMLEQEPEFGKLVARLCGHDDEDPTEIADDPFGSR